MSSLSPFSLQAQTAQSKDTVMNRVVVVEQEYNPDIMDASKVNVLPKVEEPAVVKRRAEYALTPLPASSIPAGVMESYFVRENQPDAAPGYVRGGYGNYGNLDVLGNYLFRISDRDRLNLCVQADGMNGKLDLPDGEGEWKSRYYRVNAGADYTHRFRKVDFDLGARFGMSDFNLLPPVEERQRFVSGDFKVGVGSTSEDYPLRFKVEAGATIYDRRHNNCQFSDDGLGERQARLKGWVSGDINDFQRVRIGVDMRSLFYDRDFALNNGSLVYEDRTALALNPRYEFLGENWNLRLGASVDFSFGGGKTFRAAPDVTAGYTFADSYTLYVEAGGGKLLNDFRRLEELCPYALPVNPICDTYEQLNAALGFKASPYPGVWFHLRGGYRYLKDDLYQEDFQLLNLAMTDSRDLYAGLAFSYAYKDVFSFAVDGKYHHWDADTDYALLLKPVFELKCDMSLRPVKGLSVGVGYDYTSREEVDGVGKLSAVNNLRAEAAYTLFKGVSAYARVNNLLNKDYQYYLGYPVEGLNFVGGLSFRF